MRSDSSGSFDRVFAHALDLARTYPDGIVLIGGVAVSLHARAEGFPLQEATHDVDFLVSLSDYSAIRDIEEVTSNPRLGKSQIIREGVDFDVYVEHRNKLAVPYDEAFERSTVVDGARVASLEHLLVLKVDAAIDRAGSAKGRKDERDLIRIISMMPSPDSSLLAPYMSERRLSFLQSLIERPAAFQDLADGNAHKASILRKQFGGNFGRLHPTDHDHLPVRDHDGPSRSL